MTCTNPKFLFPTGFFARRKSDGVEYPCVFFGSSPCVHFKLNRDRGYVRLGSKVKVIDVNVLSQNGFVFGDALRPIYQVPCGHCRGCLADRSRDWVVRNQKELDSCHGVASFLTLTYDDEHFPQGGVLVKRDLQLFLKRLRTYCPETIRFFASGEYGSRSNRPHYHLIVYGLDFPLDDRKNGVAGALISKIWGKGICYVGDVNAHSISYVCRYVLKKADGFKVENSVPEFVNMSRNPGIGSDFFSGDTLTSVYVNDEVGCFTDNSVKFYKPPRFADKRFELLYPDDFRKIADKRVLKAVAGTATALRDNCLSQGSDGVSKLNSVKDEVLKSRFDFLRRCKKL